MAINQEGKDTDSSLETFEGMTWLHQIQRDEWVEYLMPKF